MIRRVFIPSLQVGEAALPAESAHHLRDVLRLSAGDEIELFDADGASARATILSSTQAGVRVRVGEVTGSRAGAFSLVVVSAVPKGNRADWLVEKLSELGASAFVPLAAARSIVLPEGAAKRERWVRLAAESAQQSRRVGVMRIEALTTLPSAIETASAGVAWYLSLEAGAQPMATLLQRSAPALLTLFVGPEGGWTAEEVQAFSAASCRPVSLTRTVLRIETAAIAGAALALGAWH